MNHHTRSASPHGDAARDMKPSGRPSLAGDHHRLLYVLCRGKLETLQLSDGDTTEDVKELLRLAMNAAPFDIVKVFNAANAMVPTSPRLPPNSPDRPYRLEVVATGLPARAALTTSKKKTFFSSSFNSQASLPSSGTCDLHSADIEKMTSRLAELEAQIYSGGGLALSSSSAMNGSAFGLLEELCGRMEDIRQRLEKLEQLNCMGLHFPPGPMQPGQDCALPNPTPGPIRKGAEECRLVWQRFRDLCQKSELSETVRQLLRLANFNNWNWEDAELMLLMRQMYLDLDFHLSLNIELDVLENWLFRVFQNYNHVPFHNFKHAFMVAQMMYALIWQANLQSKLDAIDLFALLTGAICHDLDHPGYNNAYQINARTQLAVRYNDISPLENHHSAMTFDILSQNGSRLFRNFGPESLKRVRETIISCILATDMAKHNQILKEFREILPSFDFGNLQHKKLLLMVLIKVSDISNEARPIQVSEPWLNCLLEEFFCQSDTEKIEGLPVTSFMDRDKVTKSTSQVGFIKFVILPLFESLGDLLPELQEVLIAPVRRQLEYYEALQREDQQAANSSSSTSLASGAVEASGTQERPENGGPEPKT